MHGIVDVDQRELALAVEGVVGPIEGDHVRVAEDGGDARRLVAGAVLRGAPVVVHLAGVRVVLLRLPLAAEEEGRHIVQVLRQQRDLVAERGEERRGEGRKVF